MGFDLIPVFPRRLWPFPAGLSHTYIFYASSFWPGVRISSRVGFYINRIPAAKMRALATSARQTDEWTILVSIRARSLRLSRATAINVSVQRVAFCN